MKASITKNFIVFTFFGFANLNAFAQENPSFDMRKVGFGMKFSIVGSEDLAPAGSPVPGGKTFLISINPTKNLRIEPEFGFARFSYPAQYVSGNLLSSGTHYGASVLGMFQKGNTNFYIGPNVGASKFIDEKEQANYTTTGVSYKKQTTTSKALRIGLIFGAEYFISNHFSLGGELGFYSNKSLMDISTSAEYKSLYSLGNLSFRAYF